MLGYLPPHHPKIRTFLFECDIVKVGACPHARLFQEVLHAISLGAGVGYNMIAEGKQKGDFKKCISS
jgi:hypothetical protein